MSEQPSFSRPIKRQTLAEQVAGAIQEDILGGAVEPGAALPTEPELARQFAVSRAVVRDATRLLLARGLVEVQHGRGVFVTPVQGDAFGEALLLALRRTGASVWDVEQFEQLLFPEAVALAAKAADDEDLATLRAAVAAYMELFAEYQARWAESPPTAAERDEVRAAFGTVLQAVLDATHNQVLRHLGRPLLRLRSLRHWADAGDRATAARAAVAAEGAHLQAIVEAIAGRDPAQARAATVRLVALPPEAVEAMRRTPVGEVPDIPVTLEQGMDDLQ